MLGAIKSKNSCLLLELLDFESERSYLKFNTGRNRQPIREVVSMCVK